MSVKTEARLCKEIVGISFLIQKKKHKKELKNLRGKRNDKARIKNNYQKS